MGSQEKALMTTATSVGPHGSAFQQAADKLLDPRMGVENMGPLLYALVRFTKPRHVLEVGAGYTSLWLLQALADNERELAEVHARCGRSPVEGVPWFIDDAMQGDRIHATLHCVDHLEHAHTTAHRVRDCASELGLVDHLQMHFVNAFTIFDTSSPPSEFLGDIQWDLLWFDGISACAEWPCFFRQAWARLTDRGLALVHSTLTNHTSRTWLQSLWEEAEVVGPRISMEVTPLTAEINKDDLANCIARALPEHTWQHRFGGIG